MRGVRFPDHLAGSAKKLKGRCICKALTLRVRNFGERGRNFRERVRKYAATGRTVPAFSGLSEPAEHPSEERHPTPNGCRPQKHSTQTPGVTVPIYSHTRSAEQPSELQSLTRISYAFFR